MDAINTYHTGQDHDAIERRGESDKRYRAELHFHKEPPLTDEQIAAAVRPIEESRRLQGLVWRWRAMAGIHDRIGAEFKVAARAFEHEARWCHDAAVKEYATAAALAYHAEAGKHFDKRDICHRECEKAGQARDEFLGVKHELI